MAKNSDRLLKMSRKEIYKQYIWENDKREWLRTLTQNFLRKFKPFLFVIVMIMPVMTVVSTPADGTDKRHYIALQIEQIQAVLPKLEKAYMDIDKLSNSISKVAYKDLDITFIYAFMITKWSAAHGLDPHEVAGIIQTESQFNLKARSVSDARGLMQINRKEWKMNDYWDAEENIKKGAQILWMFKRSHPGSYLDKYSGGAEDYAAKVKINTQKIKKSAKPSQVG